MTEDVLKDMYVEQKCLVSDVNRLSEDQSKLSVRMGDAEGKIEYMEGARKGGRLVFGGPGDGKPGKDGTALT